MADSISAAWNRFPGRPDHQDRVKTGFCVSGPSASEPAARRGVDNASSAKNLRFRLACLALAGSLGAGAQAAEPASARNMALVGAHDLAGRSAYQPVIAHQGERWIVYVGHHAGAAVDPLTRRGEENGTSVLDVTDPRAPRLLAHIPGVRGGAQMVRVCGGLPRGRARGFYLLRTLGQSAHEIWDVTLPERPVPVKSLGGLEGTHKNWWECDTGIAYLVSGVPGWRVSRVMQVYDLSDPSRPRHIRDFGLVGQQPGATGAVPIGLHGPISTGPAGNRVYMGYGVNRDGVMQILDRARLLAGPFEPTEANLLKPQVARYDLPPDYGAHTALPVLGVTTPDGVRDYVLVVNEAVAPACAETRQKVWVLDVTDERNPRPVADFDVPDQPGGFCERPGRFGAHASNESQPPVFAKRLVFFSWFNAGVRAVDIGDPRRPREVGYYIPASRGTVETNNVEVDERGYVYIVDRRSAGLHILELTGEARALMRPR
jgi:hypothetical protein